MLIVGASARKVESTKRERSVPLSDAAQRPERERERERERAWMLSNVLISSLNNSFIIDIYKRYGSKFVVVSWCLSQGDGLKETKLSKVGW